MKLSAGQVFSTLVILAITVVMIGPCASKTSSPLQQSTTTQVIKVSPVNARDELARGYSLTYYRQRGRCMGWLYGLECSAGRDQSGVTCWPWKNPTGKSRTSGYILCMNDIMRQSAVGMRTTPPEYPLSPNSGVGFLRMVLKPSGLGAERFAACSKGLQAPIGEG